MSFNIALSGLNAISNQLDTISNNIANTATVGFKSGRANFASMYAGTQPSGVYVGSTTQTVDIGGNVLSTGRSLDAAIQGKGFFVAKDSDGSMLYSRVGILSLDKDGYVVDSFGRRMQGYGVSGAMGDIQVPVGQIPAKASDTLEFGGNLSADWDVKTVPFDPADATSYNGSVTSVIHDSLGRTHTVTQYFVKTDENQITTHYSMDGDLLDNGSVPPQVLQFDTDGKMVSPAGSVALDFGTPAGASPLVVNLNYNGTTQFAGEMTTTRNADNGYSAGSMTDVSLSADGSIVAQYSNGQTQTVGMLVLATFANPDGLTPVNDTSWKASSASGEPLLATPGTGTAGSLVAGALEGSNADVTSALVDLMSAQQNYQANSKVISTENEMMRALMQAV